MSTNRGENIDLDPRTGLVTLDPDREDQRLRVGHNRDLTKAARVEQGDAFVRIEYLKAGPAIHF